MSGSLALPSPSLSHLCQNQRLTLQELCGVHRRCCGVGQFIFEILRAGERTLHFSESGSQRLTLDTSDINKNQTRLHSMTLPPGMLSCPLSPPLVRTTHSLPCFPTVCSDFNHNILVYFLVYISVFPHQTENFRGQALSLIYVRNRQIMLTNVCYLMGSNECLLKDEFVN